MSYSILLNPTAEELNLNLIQVPYAIFIKDSIEKKIRWANLKDSLNKNNYGYIYDGTENDEAIEENAFKNCFSLRQIVPPKSILSIGNYAFYYCTSLTSVNLPNATSIGESAFQGCTSLTSVNLPNATSIGESAFQGCGKLLTLIIGTNLTTVCTLGINSPFPSSIESIYIPDDLVDSYKTASGWNSYTSKIKGISTKPTEE